MPLGRTKRRRITPTDVARAREQRQLRVSLALLVAPLLAFAILQYGPRSWNPAVVVLPEHLYVVSAASLAAFAMAVVLAVASVRTREPRTFLLATGFLAVAGVFSVHGLMTPGAGGPVHELHNSLLISARLSLLLGSLLFLAATYPPPARLRDAVARHHRRLMTLAVGLVVAYVAANLLVPTLLDRIPVGTEPHTRTSAQAPAPTDADAEGGYVEGQPSSGDVKGGAPIAAGTSTPPEDETGAERIARVRAGSDAVGGYGALLEDEDDLAGAASTTLAGLTPADPPLLDRRTVGLALSYLVLAVSLTAGLLAASRFARSFALTRSEAAAGMAAGALLMAEAHVVQTFGEVWRLSWWLYHAMMLVGFLVPMAAFARAHRRGGSLVEIVDGLVLSETLAKVEYSFPEAVTAFVRAVESRDVFLRGHMGRVCALAVAIGDELRVTDTELRAASYAALLHDLGKLGMPPAILHKPGRLTDEEFDLLKEHPARGFEMVAGTHALALAAPAIRWHHERLDGSGYPDALRGDQIPIEARIIAVADVWDALTSDRVYRAAMPAAAAWEILARERGPKLDPACVDALARVLARRPTHIATIPHAPLAAAS